MSIDPNEDVDVKFYILIKKILEICWFPCVEVILARNTIYMDFSVFSLPA